jgi:hypothetical protein
MLCEDLTCEYLIKKASNIYKAMSPITGRGYIGDDVLTLIGSELADPDVILDAYENDDFWLPSRKRNTSTERVTGDLDRGSYSEYRTTCSASISAISMDCISGKMYMFP